MPEFGSLSEIEGMEVTVVGGGLAGWMAAVEALERGASVVLVERSGRRPGWGNSMISGGALHAGLVSPRLTERELLARAAELTDRATDPLIAQAWARGIPETLRWIDAHDGRLVRDGDAPHRAVVFAPVRRTEPGLTYQGMGTPRFLAELSRRFRASGGHVLQPARAHGLQRSGDAHWQLQVHLAGRDLSIRTAAVVFADGGFQASPQLIGKYVSTAAVRLRATTTSTGDALLMGQSVGAAICHTEGFYGHLLVQESLHDGRFWPYPILDALAASGVVVDSTGRRFVDESHSGVTTTNAVARVQPDRHPCWVVFDAAAWESVGRVGGTPPNPYLVDEGAHIARAQTIAELAAETGLDDSNLAETLNQVNKRPQDAQPVRGRSAAVSTAPYFAIRVVPGVTFTLGGLRVNGSAQVLDTEGRTLPGLYAAGGTMGGLHGGPRDGYLGGLLEAAVFGRIAGRHAGEAHGGGSSA